jgi:hypothetical protein
MEFLRSFEGAFGNQLRKKSKSDAKDGAVCKKDVGPTITNVLHKYMAGASKNSIY